jgi:hypothetical protein
MPNEPSERGRATGTASWTMAFLVADDLPSLAGYAISDLAA